MTTNFDDVKAFHEKFLPDAISTKPRLLDRRVANDRVQFLDEELAEFIDAMHDDDIAGQADALVDLVYVALGTAVMMGLPWQQLWDDVQRANMTKVRGPTKRGAVFDVKKPAGWVGPQTHTVLREAGWGEEETTVP